MTQKKIERFLDTVYSAAEAKSSKMIREIDRAGENAIKEFRDELRRSVTDTRRREDARARRIWAEAAAKDEAEIRRALLDRRSAIADEVFSEVCRRVEEYKKTPAYRETLLRNAAEIAGALRGTDGAELFISAGDEAMKTELEAAGLPVRITDSIKLGGIRGVSAEMECDCTLDTRLKAAKEDFTRESGLSVV